MEAVVSWAKALLLNGSMVVLLFGMGIYLTVKSGCFPLRGLPYIFRHTLGSLLRKDKPPGRGSISSFQAVTTALAGTMGVGNIAGVATAITLGGPGAIFWMWVSSFFGMMTKYAETYLAMGYRVKKPGGGWAGGPMYYMEQGLGKKGMACLFAVLCVLASFGTGNMSQVNAVSGAALAAFGIPTWGSGLLVALLLALVIFGGLERIARVNEFLIPFITVAYIACAVTALLRNSALVGPAFGLIFRGAFSLSGAAGGVAGYGVSTALRYGISRGVFTHEAGLGSAPIAYAAAECDSPQEQSVWGIFEVFLDTIVVCTLTALVLLTAGEGSLWQSGLDGVAMTAAAFAEAFGPMGANFIALAVVVFAVAGMLGWCFYGESCLEYLTGGKRWALQLYRCLFILAAVLGAVGSLRLVWGASDLLNAGMAIPNVIALWLLRGQIRVPATGGKKARRPAPSLRPLRE